MSAATSLPPASALGEDELSDAQLVARVRHGDTDAADVLIGRHLQTVQAVCRSRLSSPHDVNDAVQDTFVRALTKLDRLRDPERIAPWLRAIAARVCVDQYRATRHVVVVPSPGAEHADLGRGPEEHAVGVDVARKLHDKLDALSQRDRRALWLRDAEGVPVPEVARDLGVTEGSARVLLTRARHRLRASYQGLAGVAIAGWIRLRDRLVALDQGTGIDVRTIAVAQAAVAAAIVVAGLPAPAGPAEVTAPSAPAVAPTVAPELATVPESAPALEAVAPEPTAAPRRGAPPTVAPSEPTQTETEVTAGPATISKGEPPADAEPAAQVQAGDDERPVGEALVYVGDVLGGDSGGDSDDERSGRSRPSGDPSEPSSSGGSETDGGLFGGGLVELSPR